MITLLLFLILFCAIGLTEGWKFRPPLPDTNKVINGETYHAWRTVQTTVLFVLMWILLKNGWQAFVLLVMCDRIYNRFECFGWRDNINELQPPFHIGFSKKWSIDIPRWPVIIDWILAGIAGIFFVVYRYFI